VIGSRSSIAILSLVIGVAAQGAAPPADDTLVGQLPWRSIGPANMSGRVTDIAVPKGIPTTVYCATATGGVWKTVNNGTTWTAIFNDYGTGSIGTVAVADSNPDIVWVGTGEANASSYTSWGDGVYKSTDGGRTFAHMGLADTHHIGRILIHPTDPRIVYVAALGHLWGPNTERGLYRTRDGGATWKNVKFISEDAGFVDMAMDRRNPQVIYAAAYARRSDRFDDFDSVGIAVLKGGGIFKTTDGGDTWAELTNGLPRQRVGRIGLEVARSAPDRIYAIVEVAPVSIAIAPTALERIRVLLRGEKAPESAEATSLRELIRARAPGDAKSAVVAGLSRSEQAQVRVLLGMDAPDTGGGVFRSDDAGRTWKRTNPLNEREGYYSQIRADPNDADRVYALMVRTWSSSDGARTFEQEGWAFSSSVTSDFIHGDFHALWIDPANANHMIVGSDGGLYSTYDRGAHFEAHQMPIGQFVGIGVDMQRPYFVYGGLQDNGTWGGPSATRHRSGVTTGDWYRVAGADGAYTHVDPANPNLIYTASQYGNLLRVDLATGQRRSIRPRASRGEPALRFNYIAPFILSARSPSTLYMGAERVFRSTNRGESWSAISPDLTKGKPNADTGEGATITTVAESPNDPAVLWAGTDDGNLHVTRDGGATWTNVADKLPGAPRSNGGAMKSWVSRVEASRVAAGTAYVSLDAHRDDDRAAYLYRTTDYGQSWESIVANLPADVPIHVVREDRRNQNLLFVGTETSIFASIDRGRTWRRLANGIPTVRVDDLVIHPRDPELVAGTHGRSLYVLDISALEELTPPVLDSDAHLFTIRPTAILNIDLTRNKAASGARRFAAPNPFSELVMETDPSGARRFAVPNAYNELDASGAAPSGAAVYYYLKAKAASPVTIAIVDSKGDLVRELTGTGERGINRVLWDLRRPPLPPEPPWRRVGGNDSRRLAALPDRPGAFIEAGDYQVRLRVDGRTLEQALRVDPDVPLR
jgi:photosystem II stability/assembly factor-like uncharacterized protein